MSKKLAFLLLFILISVTEVVVLILGVSSAEPFVKPLIVPALLGYYFVTASKRSWVFMMALVFCWVGDLLLLVKPEAILLVYGLFAFLIAHVLYIVSYRQHTKKTPNTELGRIRKIRIAFPVILGSTGLFVILYPGLGAMKIPVFIYSVVLTAMVVGAISRMRLTPRKSFWMVFYGAFLFMISDSILAVNQFHTPVAHASIWVMITYCIAQFLIVDGILRHPGKSHHS